MAGSYNPGDLKTKEKWRSLGRRIRKGERGTKTPTDILHVNIIMWRYDQTEPKKSHE